MSDRDSIVIVGGGHAGAQLCGALAAAGRARGVHLVCEEPELPVPPPAAFESVSEGPRDGLAMASPGKVVR